MFVPCLLFVVFFILAFASLKEDAFAWLNRPVCSLGQVIATGMVAVLAITAGYEIGFMNGTNEASLDKEPWHRVAKVSYEWERHP